MKKIKFYFNAIFCFSAFLIAGCSKSELKNDHQIEQKSNNIRKVFSVGDGIYDVLGYGYNVTKDYANINSVGYRIVDVERLARDQSSRIETGYPKTQDWHLIAGENAEDYLKQVTKSINVTAGDALGLFKSTITSKFDETNAFSSKYLYGSYNLVIQRKNLKFNGSAELLRNYLDPAFIADVQSYSPQQLISQYGTHVLSNFIMGGKMEILYRSETYHEDRKFAANAGLDISVGKVFNVKVNGSINYTENDTKDNYSQSLRYKTVGGDPTKGFIDQIELGPGKEPQKLNIAAWQASCTVENAQLIDINSDGLIPIYELISDPVKKEAVKQYLISYLQNNGAVTEYTPVPVYSMLYTDNDVRSTNHVISITPEKEFYLSKNEGVVFYAFAQQKPGTVPLLRYYSRQYNDNFFTIDPSQESLGPYAYEKIAFYVYPNQIPGSRPVYRYFSDRLLDHYYPVVQANYGQNYKYERIAFYVPN